MEELSTLDKTLLAVIEAFKPKIFLDGDQYCCLYGENIQEGIAAFGVNPMNAVYNFWMQLYAPTTLKS